MDTKEIQAWRTIVAILRETGYDKLYDEEVHIVAECLCRYEQRVKKQKEVIDRLNFIKNRKNQGASQENINKMAIEFVNSYLKEVSE